MLEKQATLKTWGIPALDFPQAAVQKPDHRMSYLEFEGEISGERGQVKRVAQGTYELVTESAEEWVVVLSSPELQGTFKISRATGGWVISRGKA